MQYRTEAETENEVPLEENQYFRARLAHLLECEPRTLIALARTGRLLDHLRQTAVRGLQTHLRLLESGTPPDLVVERDISSVADPRQGPAEVSSKIQEKAAQAFSRFNESLLNVSPTYVNWEEETEAPMDSV
jgi:hypothetical protein